MNCVSVRQSAAGLALIHMMNGGLECHCSLNEHCRKLRRSALASQQTRRHVDSHAADAVYSPTKGDVCVNSGSSNPF